MDKRQKILIVDDAKFNRDILKEILGDAYNYLEAEDGNQAIQMIGENIGIDLMLLDINMPQMNGFEVLKIMKRSQCIAETPVIMISSEDAVDTMRKAYELGITDYITRPFDSVIVKKRVQNTLGLYMNQKHLINVVYDQVYEKEENNNIMIRIMSNILGSRNSESREHILHIKTATEMMLRQLVKVTDAYPLTEADIALITTASSLHDIGKIRIPEEILNKPDRLTDEEFKIMKTHSELGAAIIKDMDFPQDHPLVHTAWEISRWHHERWDGKGYPDGLKGEEIPISAQVVSIVDVYDALTSERCYKKAFDHDTAIQMILDGQCGQFNPILLKCLKELSTQLSKMLGKGLDDNKYFHEAQKLSNEILSDKSLPNQCGTHALAIALFGNLRPGDEMLAPAGKPYDTLEEVIGIRPSKGSLAEYGVTYRQVDLLEDGTFDYENIRKAINEKTKLVEIQRSKGYMTRPSFSVKQIGELIAFVKSIKPDVICMVDNCYGEFVDTIEPSDVGADMVVGSLIKNPGGGLAPIGGYIAGTKECVENASYRMTCPGLGAEVGASLGVNRSFYQGFFLAPMVTKGALKGAVFAANIYEKLGFDVVPNSTEPRQDIIQAVTLKSPERLIAFCKGIQAAAPVDSYVDPEPWDMPGYDSQVIMAAGAFVQGSSIELSADGPVKEPYAVYFQGGLTWEHAKLGVMMSLQKLVEQDLVKLQ